MTRDVKAVWSGGKVAEPAGRMEGVTSNRSGASDGFSGGSAAERRHAEGIARTDAQADAKAEDSSVPTPSHIASHPNPATLNPADAYPFPTAEEDLTLSDAISVATGHNDDPWSAALDDQLGVADEAKAFARLAAARAFRPPMAVGIFGDWGTGKSFLMRLVYEHIARLTSGAPSAEAPEATPEIFLQNVVQVRFNAWHYAETNLWASLVDHLFSELDVWLRARNNVEAADSLLENLSTARSLTLQSAQSLIQRKREQHAAAERLASAQAAYDVARQSAAASHKTYWQVLRGVLTREVGEHENGDLARRRKAFETAAEKAGVSQIAENAAGLVRVSRALGSEAGRARLLGSALLQRLQRKRHVAMFAAIVLGGPVLAAVALEWLRARMSMLQEVREGMISAGVVLSGVLAWLGSLTRSASSAVGELERAKAALDKEIEKQTTASADQVKNLQKGLANLAASVETAHAELKMASEQLKRANAELASSSGAERLLKFIRARADDKHYARHLGLVANVRKDFEELAAAVADAGTAQKNALLQERAAFDKSIMGLIEANASLLTAEEIQQLTRAAEFSRSTAVAFERIVLYIDDLDRCPPDKVVDVLQAVHLLLTFPIFVVFVAVDARWVRSSLVQHYGQLLSAKQSAGDVSASASDYLEKIFQIPYWIRPMDTATSCGFVRGRLQTHLEAPEEMPAPRSTPPSPPETAARTASILLLSGSEAAFLERLAPFAASSPRRALRFVNVYRLIKASLPPAEAKRLMSGDYIALMAQVALATAAPEVMPTLTRQLPSFAESSVQSLKVDVLDQDWSEESRRVLAGSFEAYEEAFTELGWTREEAVHALSRYARTAARYSFSL